MHSFLDVKILAYARGGPWYFFLFAALTGMIVYPDKVLEWFGERVGRDFGWLYLIPVVAAGIALMITATVLLMRIYPKLHWWWPVVCVVTAALTRLIIWWLTQGLGFDD
jgi:hypothetical protein